MSEQKASKTNTSEALSNDHKIVIAKQVAKVAIVKVVDDALYVLTGEKKRNGRTEIFGGQCEAGEDPEAAARRELSEELGGVTLNNDLTYLRTVTYPGSSEGTYVQCHLFGATAEVSPDGVRLSEHCMAQWTNVLELLSTDMKVRIAEAVIAEQDTLLQLALPEEVEALEAASA